MISDQVVVTVATGFFSLIGTIFTGIMTYYLARLNKKADNAAVKAEEVKATLNVANEETAKKIQQNTIEIEQNRQNFAKSTDAIVQVTEKLSGIDTVSTKIDEVKEVGEQTHKLVNGAMLAQLKTTLDALKRVAELTNTETDIEAARIAEESYASHLESPTNPNKQVL